MTAAVLKIVTFINVLFRSGIKTQSDLLAFDLPFGKIRCFGVKTFEELKAICKMRGWDFKGVF